MGCGGCTIFVPCMAELGPRDLEHTLMWCFCCLTLDCQVGNEKQAEESIYEKSSYLHIVHGREIFSSSVHKGFFLKKLQVHSIS